MANKRFKKWDYPKIKHGKLTKWNWMVQYPEGLKLGKYTDIGAFTYINAKYEIQATANIVAGENDTDDNVLTVTICIHPSKPCGAAFPLPLLK